MADIKQINYNNTLYNIKDNFSIWGGNNLLTQYVDAGGRAKNAGKYTITLTGENADTYFTLYLSERLEANKVYTISCDVSGLLSGSYYNFPLYAQGNTSMGVLQLNKNGRCSLTFTQSSTYANPSATTKNNHTVYPMFMDDAGRSLASGQGDVILKNWKLEEGHKATDWSPCYKTLFTVSGTQLIVNI